MIDGVGVDISRYSSHPEADPYTPEVVSLSGDEAADEAAAERPLKRLVKGGPSQAAPTEEADDDPTRKSTAGAPAGAARPGKRRLAPFSRHLASRV